MDTIKTRLAQSASTPCVQHCRTAVCTYLELGGARLFPLQLVVGQLQLLLGQLLSVLSQLPLPAGLCQLSGRRVPLRSQLVGGQLQLLQLSAVDGAPLALQLQLVELLLQLQPVAPLALSPAVGLAVARLQPGALCLGGTPLGHGRRQLALQPRLHLRRRLHTPRRAGRQLQWR